MREGFSFPQLPRIPVLTGPLGRGVFVTGELIAGFDRAVAKVPIFSCWAAPGGLRWDLGYRLFPSGVRLVREGVPNTNERPTPKLLDQTTTRPPLAVFRVMEARRNQAWKVMGIISRRTIGEKWQGSKSYG